MTDLGLVGYGPLYPGLHDNTTSSASSARYPLDDSDDRAVAILSAPRTGQITHVGISVYSVTGTPPTYNVAVVTVSGTTGIPTNTAYGGGAPGVLANPVSGWQWVQLATPSAVTAGDNIGLSVWPTGVPGNPDGSNYITVQHSHFKRIMSYPASGYAVSDTYMSGSACLPAFAIRYSDGRGYGWPRLSNANVAFNASDSPDEYGIKLTLPFGGRCVGCAFALHNEDSNASWENRLVGDDGSVLATDSIADEDILLAANSSDTYGVFYRRWAPVVLESGQTVRLTIRATHATATVTPVILSWSHESDKDCFVAGDNVTLTSCTDGGAWTDDYTKVALMALLFDDITIGGGSSGPRWV